MTEPEQAAPVDLDAAHLALDAAVAQLVQPSTERLDRADGLLDEHVAAQRADDRATTAELQRRLATHRAAGRDLQAALVMRQLRDHRRRVVKRRTSEAVTATAGVVPSLLDQLGDAVESTGGGGGASAGVHRSPIGLAAAELLGHIERGVGHRYVCPLADDLRAWAKRVLARAEHDPGRAVAAAVEAEEWVQRARSIVSPERRMSGPGRCPVCDNSVAYVRDDAGEIVRRPALQLDPTTKVVRCIVPTCTGYWGPDKHAFLASVLEQQAQERAG